MTDTHHLLREADELGIINIDVNSGTLSPALLQYAIGATKRLDASLDRVKIAAKLREADLIVAVQH